MAVGIRYYAIFNLILVLFAAQTIFGEVNTHESSNKVRRSPAGSPVNSFQWKKDDNINKLRKDILASIPADYQAVLLKQHSEEEHGDAPQDLAALDQVGRPGHETDARDVLNHFLSRQSARNNKHEAGLESKRNGFFFGKRNGFFFGKRDTEAVNSDLQSGHGSTSQFTFIAIVGVASSIILFIGALWSTMQRFQQRKS